MDHMTMTMATSTASSAMPSSTGMDMDMDMGSSSSSSHSMSSADMAMVFFQSVTTPLYAYSWTPAGEGSYAGTCIFLIVLGLAHRVLIALRFVLFDSNPSLHRHLHTDNKLGAGADVVAPGPGFIGRQVRFQWSNHPFRVATETSRALLEVVIGGVGMLAVMTMNVGYFLSVLGGIFLGSFVAGRFQANDNHH
ncbi:putative low affinity copper transporter protein [Eutypa lata UCREL1]|uniref:Copper transport protein n=1 Tax=Eutypa lata (strain UCR-EL1) TaxID=1287681 RepID=M7SFR7_EUTLA|nr:putative low affinity copper transporter protein [Eutypa lata UCREL1]